MRRFYKKVAVVTGASSGIGKAITLGLAAQGATLCLVGRELERLDAVAKAARMTTPRLHCYEVDLTLDRDVKGLVESLDREYKRIDILVHSAGLIALGSLEAAHIDDLDDQYRTNVRAPYLLTQALLPMLKKDSGQIVFINSSIVSNARANVSQYSATKYALKAFSDSLRAEVNSYGVRVLSIYPGRTATPMQAMIHEMDGKHYRPERLLQAEDVAAVVINALSLPRTAEVTEIYIRPMSQ